MIPSFLLPGAGACWTERTRRRPPAHSPATGASTSASTARTVRDAGCCVLLDVKLLERHILCVSNDIHSLRSDGPLPSCIVISCNAAETHVHRWTVLTVCECLLQSGAGRLAAVLHRRLPLRHHRAARWRASRQRLWRRRPRRRRLRRAAVVCERVGREGRAEIVHSQTHCSDYLATNHTQYLIAVLFKSCYSQKHLSNTYSTLSPSRCQLGAYWLLHD